MKLLAFKELLQLQAFVFVKGDDNDLEPDRWCYRGPDVVVKLNDQFLVALGVLLATNDKTESSPLGQIVSPDEAGIEVIPVDVGIHESRLHELVMRAGLGQKLINLGRRR